MNTLVLVVLAFFLTEILTIAQVDMASDRSERIRKEYRGSETPDHIMFGYSLLSIKGVQAQHPDIAIQLVQKHFQLDSEEDAEVFLSRMLVAATELESEWESVQVNATCGPDSPRTQEAMYITLDQVDDLRENKSRELYAKFMPSLDEGQQEFMIAWLQKKKDGFYYRTAEHKSMYENTDYDVVGHVDMVCAERASPDTKNTLSIMADDSVRDT
jgi:hypothetical protein